MSNANPEDFDFVTFALSRFGYGPTADDLSRVSRTNFPTWVTEQLKAPVTDDAATAERLANLRYRIHYNGRKATKPDEVDIAPLDEMRGLETLNKPIEDIWPALFDKATPRDGGERRRPLEEMIAATLVRAVYSPYQLRETLVQFWHDHFNVNGFGGDQVMVAMPSYDRDAIRKHALGNFREMLEAVGSSTAMLYYLSNHSSRAGAANENYARELFELHTLGRDAYLNDKYDKWRAVPGALTGAPSGYIDQDVYEAARAFTGWTVEDGAGIDGQRKLPMTGKFIYVDGWHDGYQKRVLAHEFDPFSPSMADGRKVLDLVADHPATAQHMAQKLCVRYIGPNVSAAFVQQTAELWRKQAKAPDQIARVVSFIALSDEFKRSRGAKVKRPLTLAAAFLRITGSDFTPTEGFYNALAGAGQRLFGYPAPTGLPDENEAFLGTNAMRNRWGLLLGLAQNNWQTGICDPSRIIPPVGPDGPMTVAEYTSRWFNVLRVPSTESLHETIVTAMGLQPTATLANLDIKHAAVLAALPAFAPQFQMS